jgi:hypothetical protein
MDMAWLKTRKEVPAPLCREMEAACRANVAIAERQEPEARRKFAEACEAVIAWVELDGKIEQGKRADHKRFWQDQIYRHASDRRHWLLMCQAWRKFNLAHPEASGSVAGAPCSHGYPSPMCVADMPVLKSVPREPGEDDE